MYIEPITRLNHSCFAGYLHMPCFKVFFFSCLSQHQTSLQAKPPVKMLITVEFYNKIQSSCIFLFIYSVAALRVRVRWRRRNRPLCLVTSARRRSRGCPTTSSFPATAGTKSRIMFISLLDELLSCIYVFVGFFPEALEGFIVMTCFIIYL